MLFRSGVLAVLSCPCHLPILAIVLTGTGAGVFLGDYWVIVGIALTGYLDYVLLPALAIFIGLTVYALWRKRKYDACCDTPSEKESQP